LQAAGLYRKFIQSDRSHPTPRQYFSDNDEVVKGTSTIKGFKNATTTGLVVSGLLRTIAEELHPQIANGYIGRLDGAKYSNLDDLPANQAIEVPIDSLLRFGPGTRLDASNKLLWGGPPEGFLSIPAILAGEFGEGGDIAFSGEIINVEDKKDARDITGNIVVKRNTDKTGKTISLDLSSDALKIEVKDTIDFLPGNQGNWLGYNLFLRDISELEAYNWAYDVPFTATFTPAHSELRIHIADPEPDPDPNVPNPQPGPRPTPGFPPPKNPPGPSNPWNPFDWPVIRDIIRIFASRDPNDIIGPAGAGQEHWITTATSLPYTILFENKPEATASVHQLKITQKLDADLDWRTFRIGNFGWGDLQFTVPEKRSFYSDRLNLTSTLGLYVDVAAGIDVTTGDAYWTLTAINPATGEMETDPLKGFLPPNDAKASGQGFVNYSVGAKRGTATGTVIDAQARIIFDYNEPIDTPTIFNTIDSDLPVSSVATLPIIAEDTTFTVSWSGQDSENGSAVADYTIYVSKDGGAYTPWLTNTTLSEATYTGERGHTYAFYSIARDNAGNSQPIPAVAQATIRVAGGAPVLNVNNLLVLSEGSTATITQGLLNVTDLDNTPAELVYKITDLPDNGVLSLNGTVLAVGGSFTQADLNSSVIAYQHNGSETTQDAFKFTLADPTGNTLSESTFEIGIAAVNDAPIANADKTLTLLEDAAAIALNINAPTDAENDSLTIAVTALPNAAKGEIRLVNGTAVALNQILSITELQQLVFAPVANANGAAGSFTYTVSDGNGGTASQVVNLDITPVNDAPVVAADRILTLLEDSSPVVLGIAAPTDVDDDALNIKVTTLPDTAKGEIRLANGTAVVANQTLSIAELQQLVFTPVANANGAAGNFSYTANDDNGGTATQVVTLNITPVNDAPVAFDDTAATNANTPLIITAATLLANDTDIDGDILRLTGVSNAVNGTVALNANGDVVFTPTNGFSGAASFNYTVSDGSATATANVTVTVIDPPLVLQGTNRNDTLTGKSNNDQLYGNAGNDTLIGNAGDDLLDGGTGIDSMVGGNGNDTYVVNTTGDVIIEKPGEGTDTVQSSITWTLGDSLENLILTGIQNINGTGNGLDNTLTGNTGNNVLDGGAGNDTLIGKAGNDTYIIDSNDDVIIELANEGTDTVKSSINWTLGDNLENLILTGTQNINGIGNSLNNSLTGNASNNTLDGVTGNDTLIGGAGDDTYIVNSIGDLITELAGSGTDTILSSINWTLNSNLENLTLTDNDNINGTGNGLDNVITGNTGNNVLNGGAGNDTLTGNIGNDTLLGGIGNDHLIGDAGDNYLDGGSGDDSMTGGTGNDTYIVNSLNDAISENTGEGTDTVKSSVSWTLADNLENLELTGIGAISGTGNSLDNTLTGNAGSNILDGGAGNDTMRGGGGNDTYIVDSLGDVAIEDANSGTDTINAKVSFTLVANVENLTLLGTAVTGTGNDLNNTIIGNAGNNILAGGKGNDTITGGAGTDTFVLNQPSQGVDTIKDFISGTDKVDVSATEFGGGLVAGTALLNNQIRVGAGVTTANSATQRFLFNTNNGNLYFDADGVGGSGAVQIAKLESVTSLNINDFQIRG
jgi:Ca2+-binding RTX toxin-like protein